MNAKMQHAAALLAQGMSFGEVAKAVGSSKSSVHRWATSIPAFQAAVEAAKQATTATPLAQPTPAPRAGKDVDFGYWSRQLRQAAVKQLVTRIQSGDAKGSDIASVIKLLDGAEDHEASPAALADALKSADLDAVMDAFEPNDAQRVAEAVWDRCRADLEGRNFGDPNVETVFQLAGQLVDPEVAQDWLEAWGPAFEVANLDLRRRVAMHQHAQFAERNGEEPDTASINKIHPVDAMDIVDAAVGELLRIRGPQ